jgi:deoxyguanosine kinase
VKRFRHIAVEGVIGVGKTTLAHKLAAMLHAELLLERPEDNPFIEKFYTDRARYALPTQLSFLFQRVEQAKAFIQGGVFSQLVVSDFMFAKDRLFAQLTLSDDEFSLYQRISQDVAPPVPEPDLVIWLRAPATVLLERVRRRARPMEASLAHEDLHALEQHYAQYFAEHVQLPLLSVATEHFDFERSSQALDTLMARLASFVGPRETLEATGSWVGTP